MARVAGAATRGDGFGGRTPAVAGDGAVACPAVSGAGGSFGGTAGVGPDLRGGVAAGRGAVVAVALSETIHAYRVQWQEGHAVREVVATVDRAGSAVTVTVPDGAAFTVSTIAARAVSMILSDAVYRVLQPAGPFLTIEVNTGAGWHDLRRATP